MNPAKKIDSNTHEIKRAFEELGYEFIDTHEVGKGYPDSNVRRPDWSFVMQVEIKNGNAPYTQDEIKYMIKHPGLVKTVRSVEDVKEMFG